MLDCGLSQIEIMKADLLAKVDQLGPVLPTNTLDQLIDDLGGVSYVAEVCLSVYVEMSNIFVVNHDRKMHSVLTMCVKR